MLLFAEEASRIIVALPRENWAALGALAQSSGANLFYLGQTGSDALRIERGGRVLVETPVQTLEGAWRMGLA